MEKNETEKIWIEFMRFLNTTVCLVNQRREWRSAFLRWVMLEQLFHSIKLNFPVTFLFILLHAMASKNYENGFFFLSSWCIFFWVDLLQLPLSRTAWETKRWIWESQSISWEEQSIGFIERSDLNWLKCFGFWEGNFSWFFKHLATADWCKYR